MKKITALLIPLLLILTATTANCWTMDLIWERLGDNDDSRFGKSIAGLGDSNEDGYGDFAVGAFTEKKIYIFYGGNPPDTIPDVVIDSSAIWGMRGMNDLNGDNIYDLVTWSGNKVTIYFGQPGYNSRPDLTLNFPGTVAFRPEQLTIEDFNGDGYNDLAAISAGVSVFFGGPEIDTIPDFVISSGDLPEMRLLYSVDLSGDFNGDGNKDLLVGNGTESAYPDISGYFYIYYGGPYYSTIPDFILTSGGYRYIWDYTVFIGDINNDEYSDIKLSYGGLGAEIYCGGNPPSEIPCDTIANMFTYKIGDVNRDGQDDFISLLGGPSYCVYLWKDNLSSTFARADFCMPSHAGDFAYVGDVTGNGCGDLLVGFGYLGRGVAKLYSGNPDGVPGIEEEIKLPSAFQITNIYPNPFNTTFHINYYLPNESKVDFEIYNILGRLVKRYVTERRSKGNHTESITMPSGTSSGLYFLMAKYGEERIVRKVTFLK